jgi:hypothetical protein
MTNRHAAETEFAIAQANPRSSSSLVPMLIAGLVLTVAGMFIALAFV